MRIAMIGAGGIGAFYAARLIAAGHQVQLCARGEHLKALQRDGLTVIHPEFHFKGGVSACDLSSLMENHSPSDFQLLILALKAGATEEIMRTLSPWLNSPLPVLSLQNGVDNEPLIAQTIGRDRTLGGLAVRIGGHITKPGVIEATGPAQVILGPWPDANSSPALEQFSIELSNLFNAASIPTTYSNQIHYQLWRKLIINNGVNPLSALTELDTKQLTSHPSFGETVKHMMNETAIAAQADGITLSAEDVDEMYELICQFDAIKTSMLVDREKNRPLELEAICGAVLKRCQLLNRPAPVTQLVNALLLKTLSGVQQ